MQTFEKESLIGVPARTVFDWHLKEGAFERLIPPWESVEVVSRSGRIEREGSRVTLSIGILGPIRIEWIAEHRHFEPGRRFQDIQVKGPFQHWVHTHEMIPDGPDRCLLRDQIEYRLPGGWLGERLGGWVVRRKLKMMFEYRHRVTREVLEGPDRRDPPGRDSDESGDTSAS